MKEFLSVLSGRFALTCITLLSTFLAGCGGGLNDGYKGPRGSVSGKVTVAGTPVPPGTLILFQGTTTGFLATGEIKEEGQFSLTFQGDKQIPAVDYLVQVSPPVVSQIQDSANPLPSSKQQAASASFSAKYQDVTTSQLSFTVKEGENTANFDLQK